MADKKADLAGPGIGNYEELEAILPQDYHSLLNSKETQRALFDLKEYIEDHLQRAQSHDGSGPSHCRCRERCE